MIFVWRLIKFVTALPLLNVGLEQSEKGQQFWKKRPGAS
jgi:hypothetical protein